MDQTEDTAAAYGLASSFIDPDSGEWASGTRHTVAYGGRHGTSAERYYSGLLYQYIWWTAVASDSRLSGRGGVEKCVLQIKLCNKRTNEMNVVSTQLSLF